MRVIGYLRVSTEEQAVDGVSLAAQRQKVVAYAALYEHEVVEIIEEDQSAKDLKRPKLQRALAMLRSGVVDGILVAKMDRLTRNLGDWQHLIDNYFCERKGKTLMSMGECIDTTTAVGRMMLNMVITIAAWERETIGERTRDALQYKRSRGELVGAVPFGYDLGPGGVKLVENQAEQRVLALIKDLRRGGMSLRRIAVELSSRNVPTKEGKRNWTHSTIQRILNRKAVAA